MVDYKTLVIEARRSDADPGIRDGAGYAPEQIAMAEEQNAAADRLRAEGRLHPRSTT